MFADMFFFTLALCLVVLMLSGTAFVVLKLWALIKGDLKKVGAIQ